MDTSSAGGGDARVPDCGGDGPSGRTSWLRRVRHDDGEKRDRHAADFRMDESAHVGLGGRYQRQGWHRYVRLRGHEPELLDATRMDANDFEAGRQDYRAVSSAERWIEGRQLHERDAAKWRSAEHVRAADGLTGEWISARVIAEIARVSS